MEAATQAAIDRLVDGIVRVVHPLSIILFGSAARGDTGSDSDLDVLVVMPDGTPRRETAQRIHREVRGVGAPYDVLVTTPSFLQQHSHNPGLIYETILDEGKTIYAR